ncbi:MAG: hypothetical protein VW171_00335 [Alphaproteobacteria bacterium]
MRICSGLLIDGVILLQLSATTAPKAEGRMYIPKKDPPVKLQLCRLYKVERDATGTSCRYRPQKAEDDVVVSTEDPRTVCQREFFCKIK